MGWLGVVVDIGLGMTPCVALGVTIQNVVHFLLWFSRGIEHGPSVAAAVELAYAIQSLRRLHLPIQASVAG
jgi:predicted RND superfamily exporter protein